LSIKEIKVTAEKIKKRDEQIKKIIKFVLILLFLLAFFFIFLSSIYTGGRFFISLDPNHSIRSGLFMFDDPDEKDSKSIIYVEEIKYMDNISINWLPEDIGDQPGGNHNGDNYIAHTFYLENRGNRIISYWYEIKIENVIKNVDEAIRFMIIKNGERTVYAKVNSETGEAEPGTVKFKSEEVAVSEQREKMEPGDIDKITIVIFLEGDDPDCVDDLIGGEIKAHMRIIEGHIE